MGPHLGRIEIHAQVAQLHADLAVEPLAVGLLDQPLVVISRFLDLLGPGDVLAEPREEDREALLLELVRGLQRVLGLLAGHEATHGAARHPQTWNVAPHPRVTCHPEQQSSHVWR